jgi:transcriptional regulator with XRE-family HTH domain
VLQKQLGRRIAELRRQRGLTQEQFAEAVDRSVEFISLVERGINAPSVAGLQKFARALRVPVKKLFEFDSHASPRK